MVCPSSLTFKAVHVPLLRLCHRQGRRGVVSAVGCCRHGGGGGGGRYGPLGRVCFQGELRGQGLNRVKTVCPSFLVFKAVHVRLPLSLCRRRRRRGTVSAVGCCRNGGGGGGGRDGCPSRVHFQGELRGQGFNGVMAPSPFLIFGVVRLHLSSLCRRRGRGTVCAFSSSLCGGGGRHGCPSRVRCRGFNGVMAPSPFLIFGVVLNVQLTGGVQLEPV